MIVLYVILSLILLLILVVFVGALFMSKESLIQRTIVINKSRPEVYNYIKSLMNQEKFSKWVMTDPAMKKSFKGTDGTVGFCYAWDGNKKAGKGEQEIIALKENEYVDIEVRFEKPFKGVGKTPFALESVSDNQTKVTWGMSMTQTYPLNFMNAIMKPVLTKDVDTSLANLKTILEKN